MRKQQIIYGTLREDRCPTQRLVRFIQKQRNGSATLGSVDVRLSGLSPVGDPLRNELKRMPLFFLLFALLSSMHVNAGLGVSNTNTNNTSLFQSLVDTGRIQASSSPKDYIQWLQTRSEDELQDEIDNTQLALNDLTESGRLGSSAAIAVTAFLAVMLVAIIDIRLYHSGIAELWLEGKVGADEALHSNFDIMDTSNGYVTGGDRQYRDLKDTIKVIVEEIRDSTATVHNPFYGDGRGAANSFAGDKNYGIFAFWYNKQLASAQLTGYLAALLVGGLNYFPLDLPPLMPHDLIVHALKSIAFHFGFVVLLNYPLANPEWIARNILAIHLPFVIFDLVYYLLHAREERKGEVQDLKYRLKQVRRVLKNKGRFAE